MDFARSASNETQPSAEARERIESARIRDLSFFVKKVSGRTLDNASANGLAIALANVESAKQEITRDLVEQNLRQQGYGADEAAHLAGAIFA